MRFRISKLRLGIIGFVFVLGIIVGAYSISSTLANSVGQNQIKYPMNENGQTYGSALYATSPNEEPDLIKAYGIDGTLGYVKSTDLNGEMPKTPEQALEIQRNQAMSGSRKIPLYDVTGKKVIGEFQINQGETSQIQK